MVSETKENLLKCCEVRDVERKGEEGEERCGECRTRKARSRGRCGMERAGKSKTKLGRKRTQ